MAKEKTVVHPMRVTVSQMDFARRLAKESVSGKPDAVGVVLRRALEVGLPILEKQQRFGVELPGETLSEPERLARMAEKLVGLGLQKFEAAIADFQAQKSSPTS